MNKGISFFRILNILSDKGSTTEKQNKKRYFGFITTTQ